MLPNDLILYIRFVYFALEREKNQYVEQYNLTSSQGDILVFLGAAHFHKKEVNQRDIEEHFHLTNPTITGLLNRLEEKGFIKRYRNKTDGRQKLISLTDQSTKILKEFRIHKQSIEEKLLQGIDDEEKDIMIGYLKKLLSNLDPDHTKCQVDRRKHDG